MSSDRESIILDLEHEVAVLVRRLKRIISERARMIHEDLTPTGYLVLAHLVEKGPMRPSTVVDAFDLDKGAVSRHVQTLVDHGLATKERDPDDGRAWVVSVTEEARHRLNEVAASRRARLGRLLEDWSDDELGAFVATLGRYNATLD
ncbi:MarR family winged helix-turn-helix transcriptional regulator [Nocardioides piscis]|uniref:MarR family transcriptional regulator n=1 Tax=Nocardioides piscis TaxID=2714938 RepID=A0A6G7YBY2_9ACTN|nr:MarR family transcriptional regulator [Nocardioides piscis]QIK74414.1 MarR family transcriptional regulator [Nocardioides piscis]